MHGTIVHDSPPHWLDQVADLKPGQRRRIKDGQLVSHNGKGWHLYDFREKRSELYQPELTLDQRIEFARIQRDTEAAAVKDNRIPEGTPVLTDWPSEARAWLWSAGLDRPDIRVIGAVWSPRLGRVVLPLQGVETRYWIARHIRMKGQPYDKRIPKYLFPGGVARSEGAFYPGRGSDGRLILNEDFLSAYRVSRDCGTDAFAYMGTSLGPVGLSWIARNYTRVVLWGDSDSWGKDGSRSIMDGLQRRGLRACRVAQEDGEPDPKLLRPDVLAARINEAFERIK
jgi:hypothetical protein